MLPTVLAALLLQAQAPAMDAALRDTERRLRADVEHLASDAFGGRDTGSPHVARAEEHVASRFRELGLQPLPGLGSLFVPFELERDGFDPACTDVTVTSPAGTERLLPVSDYRPFDFSAEGRADAPMVFAGYGITAPEHGWDDYEGLDVAGKAVLVLRHEPRETDPASPFAGLESTQHATFTEKAENARRHGAAAILVVTDPLHHEPAEDLRWGGPMRLPAGKAPRPAAGAAAAAAPGSAGEQEKPGLPAIQISRAVAERLLLATGRSLAELQLAVDAGRVARPLAAELGTLGVTVSVTVFRRSETERVPARNVAGMLPGSDPALSSEWIVVGGHHDHVGMFHGPGDTIFNGADDNASGTAAVLELARRFAQGPRPRRSLVFVTFSAEEKGLFGSKSLVQSGTLPRDRVVFMLNDDMLGRNPERPVEAVGDGFTSGLRPLIEESAEGLGLSLQYAGDGYFGASDHEPFYEQDVPFLFLFTGTHDDYHRVGDHADKLDFDRMARLVELQERVLRRIAGAPGRPSFVHHVAWLGAKAEARTASDGLRRIVLSGVDEGSRGHRQGLRAGDAVTAVAGKDLARPEDFGPAMRAVVPASTASLEILRDGERLTVEVERAKPGWLGIFPTALDADERRKLGLREDEGLVVRRAVAGGPAAKAGIKDGDVLVRLGGRAIHQRLLQSRLAQFGAGETITASVLRDGELVELFLTLGERP